MRRIWNDPWEFAEMPLDTPCSDIPDSAWKRVKLPHDFLIPDTKALYRDATGWYRRRFRLSDLGIDQGRHIFLHFDGVYMDSQVFLNGKRIAEWKYGYSAFTVELTENLFADEENELLVRVRHQSPNTRWYSGAGIYRDVTLIDKGETWIPENGVYFHAQETAEESDDFELIIRTEVDGAEADKAEVLQTLTAPNGQTVALEPLFQAELIQDAPFVQGQEKGHFAGFRKPQLRVLEQRYLVRGAHRWDITDPALYTLRTTLTRDGAAVDEVINRVGFRSVRMDPAHGFFLNGRNFKLNGVCDHHDLGSLGAAFHRPAFRRKLRILREMGVNAVRLTHNMAAEEVLNIADEEGFLLISEAFDMWERPKTEFDYARFFKKWHARDVESWIRRDRNHPSVIMWSIGNEIYDTHADDRGQIVTADLMRLTRRFDPLKNAVATIGSNYMPWENAQKCADILKIAGYNYGEKCYEEHHAAHPDWVIYGSETSSIVMSRGVYHFPLAAETLAEEDEQCSALGNSVTSWSARSFEECAGRDRDLDFSMGQFLWSGFDYLGEPTPYHTKNSYFGQIDTAGFPKDTYYLWQSVWTKPEVSPMIHIIPSRWNFNDGQLIDVRVVSNLDDVELFLNGQSLGKQQLTHKKGSGFHLFADYQVPFTPGKLRAAAYDENGREICADEIFTCGDTADFLAECEPHEEGEDLLFYDITAVDAEGRPVGDAADLVHVDVVGPGRLLTLDNGDSTDDTEFQSAVRRLFNGKLLAVVQLEKDGGDQAERVSLKVTKVAEQIPVRMLQITAPDGQKLTDKKKILRAEVRILPENATDREVEIRAVNDTGVESNLVKLSDVTTAPDGTKSVDITALGDGSFRLRAVSKSGTDKPRVLSELEFAVEGIGPAWFDPYGFISGSLYTRTDGEVGCGNEKGVCSAREGRTVIIWDNLNFGRDFADEITVPIFTLNGDAYTIRIWRGVPGEKDAELLVDGIYQKPSIWNVYQEETWKLASPLTGIQTVSIEVEKKFHIKGFSFHRVARAFASIAATAADAVYGDLYRMEKDAVCDIGNNVVVDFGPMDFGESGAKSVKITARGRQDNSVHVRFVPTGGSEIRQLVEFPASEEYTEKTVPLSEFFTGAGNVSIVFLPGTMIDLKAIQFLPGNKGE